MTSIYDYTESIQESSSPVDFTESENEEIVVKSSTTEDAIYQGFNRTNDKKHVENEDEKLIVDTMDEIADFMDENSFEFEREYDKQEEDVRNRTLISKKEEKNRPETKKSVDKDISNSKETNRKIPMHWSDEEIKKMMELYEKHQGKWNLILEEGKNVFKKGRTAENLRKKYSRIRQNGARSYSSKPKKEFAVWLESAKFGARKFYFKCANEVAVKFISIYSSIIKPGTSELLFIKNISDKDGETVFYRIIKDDQGYISCKIERIFSAANLKKFN